MLHQPYCGNSERFLMLKNRDSTHRPSSEANKRRKLALTLTPGYNISNQFLTPQFASSTPSGNWRKDQSCQQSMHLKVCNSEQSEFTKSAIVFTDCAEKERHLSGRREEWKYAQNLAGRGR